VSEPRCPVWVALVASLVLAPLGVSGAEDSSIPAVMFPTAPVIDGVLDDEVWETAATVEGFVQFQPDFGVPSSFRTIVLIGHTPEALYVAFRCIDPDPAKIGAAIISRDGDLRDDDSVTLLLDTNHDRRTAYYFATNTLGVQLDGKVADNGRTVDDKWDATWISASARTSEGWTAEFEIPFRMLRFESGEDVSWGINFRRRIPRRLETSLWSGPGEDVWRVSVFGTLTGLDVQPQGLKRFAVIPYGLVVAEKGRGVDTKFGGDIRFRISSDLSADVTINPDFALIEADVEEINLSRFDRDVQPADPSVLQPADRRHHRGRQDGRRARGV